MSTLLDRCRSALERYRRSLDGSDDSVLNLPEDSLPEIVRAAAEAVTTEVRLIVPVRPGIYRPDSYTEKVWRQLARRGVRVRKIAVVPHRVVAGSAIDQLREQDTAAGVSTHVVTVSELGKHNENRPTAVFLFDSDLVITESSSDAGFTAPWSASARSGDIADSQRRYDEAWAWVSESIATGALSLEEPLILSADLVSGVSDVLCTADHIDPTGCAWYHGAWQYLRLFDLVSTPSWHDSFYREALGRALAATANPSVVITGTADYSMLAYVLAIAPQVPVRVLDLCPTPLFACQWYARRKGRTIEVIEADLLEPPRFPPASVVVTDAFLTRFSSDQAARVVSSWRALLRKGGLVVTTVRLHEELDREFDSEKEFESFHQRALLRARRWESFLRRSPDELAILADQYARRMKSNDLGTRGEIIDLFLRGGFQVLSAERALVPGELRPSSYLRVVAQAE